mmetsp:Transcript_16810/g.16060  ORF Transcript_16810/g.16060 Transcript_16810/m.16060 type:complete len:126 (-) Transcript_16810:903-1280(-)
MPQILQQTQTVVDVLLENALLQVDVAAPPLSHRTLLLVLQVLIVVFVLHFGEEAVEAFHLTLVFSHFLSVQRLIRDHWILKEAVFLLSFLDSLLFLEVLPLEGVLELPLDADEARVLVHHGALPP